jgi:hypothetical protein
MAADDADFAGSKFTLLDRRQQAHGAHTSPRAGYFLVANLIRPVRTSGHRRDTATDFRVPLGT